MDNHWEQIEELEVIKSIFGAMWVDNGFPDYHIDVCPNVRLHITLNPDYPARKPPTYELLAPILTRAQKEKIDTEFQSICRQNCGGPVLYQWIEWLKQFLEQSMDCPVEFRENSSGDETSSVSSSSCQEKNIPVERKQFNIAVTHGQSIRDRKSVFQAHCAKVTSIEEVRDVVDHIKNTRKCINAKHNIFAYRIRNKNGSILQDCDDDGESNSSQNIQFLLEKKSLENVVVVITRWFGGVHLGSDRFRHYNNAARHVLEQAGILK